MKITVCVPTYNGAAYLAQTLASISAQTFADFELLIVDDTSTDNTLDIAHEFAAKDSRARVVRNTERAGSSARNANQCLRHARGEWIKFLFQDDVMAPTCLARMLDAGERGPLVVSWHDYRFEPGVDDATRRWYETLPTLGEVLPGTFAPSDTFCDAVLARGQTNFIGPTSSSFIHRDCFSRYGEFNSEISSFPDLEYWIRVGSREGLAIVPEPLVTFRVHTTSISAQLRDKAGSPGLELDQLLFFLQLARAPEYEVIRRHALRRDPPLDLERIVRDLAFDARWHAGEVRYRTGSDTLLVQWKAFCDRHPAMLEILRDIDATMAPWAKLKQRIKTVLRSPSSVFRRRPSSV